MSYDLRIGVRVHGTDIIAVIDEPELSSPTYNLGKMFRACTGWDFHQGEWYNAAEVLPKIEHGIKELHLNRETYKQYDAPNGWGTTSSALEALESLRDWRFGQLIMNVLGEMQYGGRDPFFPEDDEMIEYIEKYVADSPYNLNRK